MRETWLTVAETALLLRKTPQTIRAMITRGNLYARKTGNSWRIRRAEIDTMLGAQHQEQESLSSLQAYEERERQVHRLQADIRQLSAAVARLARVLNIGISTIDDLTTPSGVVNFLVRHGVKHSTAHSWRKALPLLDFYDALRFALNRTIEAGPRARGRKLAPCSFSGTLCPCDQFFTSLSGDELDYIERTEKSPDDASPGGQD